MQTECIATPTINRDTGRSDRLPQNKKDAFIEAGKGFGKTFDYWFPMRIDFILTDKNAVINQFNSFSEKYSDHFPILARINWQN